MLHEAVPVAVEGAGAVSAVILDRPGERLRIPADQLLLAIGQRLVTDGLPETRGGKIVVDERGRTLTPGVWAGGDCASGGDDLTVTAVAQGRDAALDIHRSLMR